MASPIAPRRSARWAKSPSGAGSAFHVDGARLANAVAFTGESLADSAWRAGVDALSFGFVKNGGLNAEALILFRTELADEIAVRRKRAGHLAVEGPDGGGADPGAARGRSVARQCPRRQRRRADARRRRAGERLVYPVEANEMFLKVSADEAAALRAQGFDFYDWGPGEIRLVTAWDQQGEAVERLAAAIAAL